MRKMRSMENGEAQGADQTETQTGGTEQAGDQAAQARGAEHATQTSPDPQASEARGAEGDVRSDRGSETTSETASEEVDGLKRKVSQLMDELKPLKAEKQQKEEEEAKQRGEYEKLLAERDAKLSELEAKAAQVDQLLEQQQGDLKKAIKDLPADDRKLLPKPEEVTTLAEAQRAIALAQRLGHQASAAPVADAAPDVAPGTKSAQKTYAEMTPEEIRKRDSERSNGTRSGFRMI